MLRFLSAVKRIPSSNTRAARSIFTWGAVPLPHRDKHPHKTRWFKENFAVIDAPKEVTSSHGQVLCSELKADLDQLVHTDWTYSFNPYWIDVARSHTAAYQSIYEGQYVGPISGLAKLVGLIPNLSASTEEKNAVLSLLTKLQYTLDWAQKVEAIYTQIFDQRFILEREVWEPYERERILAGLIQLYLGFIHTVPKEFHTKVKRELEYHIFSLRRMVFDAPNVKAQFPVLMA
jgi:hypothetical protein